MTWKYDKRYRDIFTDGDPESLLRTVDVYYLLEQSFSILRKASRNLRLSSSDVNSLEIEILCESIHNKLSELEHKNDKLMHLNEVAQEPEVTIYRVEKLLNEGKPHGIDDSHNRINPMG